MHACIACNDRYVLVTVTTVGYGDLSPKTWRGQLFACIVIVCGVVFLAMPLAIVGRTFVIYPPPLCTHARARAARTTWKDGCPFLLVVVLLLCRSSSSALSSSSYPLRACEWSDAHA